MLNDSKQIVIDNAREHNLRGVSLKIPRNQIVVVTGVSGSGKSSLVTGSLYPVLNHYLRSQPPPPSTVAEFSIRGRAVNILDEPITGLHFDEIQKLCRQLHTLVHSGHTVIAIEHNLDFIKQADYVIDPGPGSGLSGGEIMFQGPFDDILEDEHSITGRHLQKQMN